MKKKHIEVLIIEDSPADYKLAELLLKESSEPSFGIRHVVRLGEAQKMLEAEHFDIILMDLELPDSSGLDGLRKITEKSDGPPVVVLTGLEDEAVGLAALRHGASDFLFKGRLTLNSLIRSLLYALTRQEMEKQLLAEQRNLQTIFDSVNVGLLLINEDGVVQRANHVIRRWVGKEPGEMVHAQPGDILGCAYALGDPAGCGHTPHCWTCSIHKTFESALSSGQSLHDVETEATFLMGGDQVRLCFSVSADPVVISGKRHVILAMNNITERKQAEAALRESEQRLARAQEIAHLGSWELELPANRLKWSDEAYRIFGLQPQEFKATYEAFLDRVHPEDRLRVNNAYASSLSENLDGYEVEHRIIRKDTGEIRVVHERCQHFRNDASKIIRSVGMVHDITERKQIEEALRESEQRLALTVHEAKIGIFDWDVLAGKFTCTVQHEIIFGYEPTTTTTTTTHSYDHFSKRIHPEDLPRIEEKIRQSMTGRTLYQMEYRVVWPDGSLHWVSASGQLNYDSSGRAVRMVGAVQDITERKKAEETLIELAYAKSKFAGTVAHELRSPLATIKAITELVSDGSVGPVNDEQKDLLGIATESIARLGRLTNNVLAFKKMEAGKTGLDLLEHDLHEVVREAYQNAALFAGNRKSDLSLDLGEDLPKIKFDRDKILQVLINLINNAVIYSEKGAIVIRTRRENSEMHVSVVDSGPGIEAGSLEKIFEPFAQLGGSKKGGTGLGLAIVKEIVLAHRGRIWAESPPKDGSVRGSVAEKVGKGSAFHFTLPL